MALDRLTFRALLFIKLYLLTHGKIKVTKLFRGTILKQSQRSFVLWLLIIALVIIAYKAVGTHGDQVTKIDYTTFVRDIPNISASTPHTFGGV